MKLLVNDKQCAIESSIECQLLSVTTGEEKEKKKKLRSEVIEE